MFLFSVHKLIELSKMLKLMSSLIQKFTSKLEAALDFYVHKLMFLSSFHKLMVNQNGVSLCPSLEADKIPHFTS